jgi:hypothetical protein
MEASAKTIHDVKETLNEYFKLKLQYETQIMANKKKIMNNSTLSNRENRAEFLKLVNDLEELDLKPAFLKKRIMKNRIDNIRLLAV